MVLRVAARKQYFRFAVWSGMGGRKYYFRSGCGELLVLHAVPRIWLGSKEGVDTCTEGVMYVSRTQAVARVGDRKHCFWTV